MPLLKLVPEKTSIEFISKRKIAYVTSGLLVIASLGLFLTQGLNYGIDFQGGILIEVRSDVEPDIASLRSEIGNLDLGDLTIQQLGNIASEIGEDDDHHDVSIRVETQPGGEEEQEAAKDRIKSVLTQMYGVPFDVPALTEFDSLTKGEKEDLVGTKIFYVSKGDVFTGFSVIREEVVGPKVSGELIVDGAMAIGFAILAVLFYIWMRFEWQFGVGAIVALVHDVALTIGFFSLTQLEFNLSIIAAILTIVGYSLNDTVVVYDRVRENLRRYRKVPLAELFNTCLNETLSRTVMTSLTTLLALLALFFFGGQVIQGFTAAMIWGVFIGTYSSIFIAVPFLLVLNLRRENMVPAEE
jgi:preprotein translocase SecF subunit